MEWNILVDTVSPVLPMLLLQNMQKSNHKLNDSKATNLYMFTGITVGGIGLVYAVQSTSYFASLANLLYWGAFTIGMQAFIQPSENEQKQILQLQPTATGHEMVQQDLDTNLEEKTADIIQSGPIVHVRCSSSN